MNSPIFIVGAGAIGKALAVFLTHANKEVILIRGRETSKESDHEEVEVTMPDQTVIRAVVTIHSLRQFNQLRGTVVLANKSFGNATLAKLLLHKIGNWPLVILQNGLGVERPFVEAGFRSVYRCVLLATSQFVGNSALNFKPVAESPIGKVVGQDIQLEALVAQLNTSMFSFRLEPDIQLFVWKKTIANCVFNSICPLLDIDNGVFYRHEVAHAMATRVVQECVHIANATGIALTVKDVFDNIILISRASDGQLISTLQDIRNNRQTEIDTLNFEIVRQAEALGLSNYVLETKLLGELIQLRSELSLNNFKT